AAFDVDLPRARARAVGAVGGAHDLVVLPAFAIALFPAPIFARDDAVPAGELALDALEEREAVEKMAHVGNLGSFRWLGRSRRLGCVAAALGAAQQAAAARVEPPGDGDAAHVEDQEHPERCPWPTRQADRGAVALRNEERAVSGDCRAEADDGRALP